MKSDKFVDRIYYICGVSGEAKWYAKRNNLANTTSCINKICYQISKMNKILESYDKFRIINIEPILISDLYDKITNIVINLTIVQTEIFYMEVNDWTINGIVGAHHDKIKSIISKLKKLKNYLVKYQSEK